MALIAKIDQIHTLDMRGNIRPQGHTMRLI